MRDGFFIEGKVRTWARDTRRATAKPFSSPGKKARVSMGDRGVSGKGRFRKPPEKRRQRTILEYANRGAFVRWPFQIWSFFVLF